MKHLIKKDLAVYNRSNVSAGSVALDNCARPSGSEDCSGGLSVSSRREDCPAGDI